MVSLASHSRHGFIFTVDVMLCMIVLVIGFVLVWSSLTEEPPKEQPYFLADDVATIMATTINADILDKIDSFVERGAITNLEYTIFEQIGEFYVKNEMDDAFRYTKLFAQNILPPQYSIAILFENEAVYNKTKALPPEKAAFLISAKRMVVMVANESQLLGPYTAEVRVW